jgi:hypothetical protein
MTGAIGQWARNIASDEPCLVIVEEDLQDAAA